MTKTNRSNTPKAVLAVVAFGLSLMATHLDAAAAERKLTFACCVKGLVEAVLVNPGDKVTAGQPLARLDATMPKLRLGVMEAKLEVAELAYTAAEKDLQRERELFDAISTTSTKVDQAAIRFAKANADLTEAQARLAKAKLVLGYTTLKAPFAGTVVSVPGFVGQVMNPDVPQETVVVLDDGK